jgi:PilZ domain.
MAEQNRRENPRYSVTLYTEYVEREAAPTRILNMSESGFLIRGSLCAGSGGVIRACFRVRPSAGEMRVSARGQVMHSRRIDEEYEYGVRIESFGSPLEESAYLAYVAELAAKAEAPSSPS